MKYILTDKTLDIVVDGQDIQVTDLSACQIKTCQGCFLCWVKTPGKCVIRDDATRIYPAIAKSEKLLLVTHVCYGGCDTLMKTLLERSIPMLQAFLKMAHHETHHFQRYMVPKKVKIAAYGCADEQEKAVFRQWVQRYHYNMNFQAIEVVFMTEKEIDAYVQKEVEEWEK